MKKYTKIANLKEVFDLDHSLEYLKLDTLIVDKLLVNIKLICHFLIIMIKYIELLYVNYNKNIIIFNLLVGKVCELMLIVKCIRGSPLSLWLIEISNKLLQINAKHEKNY